MIPAATLFLRRLMKGQAKKTVPCCRPGAALIILAVLLVAQATNREALAATRQENAIPAATNSTTSQADFNSTSPPVAETNRDAGQRSARSDAPNPRRGLKLLTGAGLAIGAFVLLLFGIVLLRALRQRT